MPETITTLQHASGLNRTDRLPEVVADIATRPLRVTSEDTETGTVYGLEWLRPPLLGAHALHAVFDGTSPHPGLETARDVAGNFRGIHEDGQEGREIIRAHRKRFGQNWKDFSQSRRLLTTVLERQAWTHLSYDESNLIYDDDCRPLQEVLDNPVELLADLIYIGSAMRFHTGLQDVKDSFWQTEVTDDHTELGKQLFARLEELLQQTDVPEEDRWYQREQHLSIYRRYDARRHVAEFDPEVRDILLQVIKDEIAKTPTDIERLTALSYKIFRTESGDEFALAGNHRTEEGIPMQAHYHQRRRVQSYYGHTILERMELPSGIDEPAMIAVPGTSEYEHHLEDRLYRQRTTGRVAPLVRPVIKWRTEADGTRTMVLNHESGEWTKVRSLNMVYPDTLSGLLIATYLAPDVAASWRKKSQIRPEGRKIKLGAAQAPLLALISRDQILAAPVFDQLEAVATPKLKIA